MARNLPEGDGGAEGERSPRAARHLALAETRRVLAAADRAYAPFSCPATAECCQLERTARPPWLWPTEWQLLLEHLKQARRALPSPRADGGCPFLDAAGARCTVYGARPFGCRTYFCHRVRGPARAPLERTSALLDQLAALNLELDDAAAPRALPELVDAARQSAP